MFGAGHGRQSGPPLPVRLRFHSVTHASLEPKTVASKAGKVKAGFSSYKIENQQIRRTECEKETATDARGVLLKSETGCVGKKMILEVFRLRRSFPPTLEGNSILQSVCGTDPFLRCMYMYKYSVGVG